MVQEEDYHGSYIKKNQMVSYLKELLFILVRSVMKLDV